MSAPDEKTDTGWKHRLNFQRESQKLRGREKEAMSGCAVAGLKSQRASASVLVRPHPSLKGAANFILPNEK